MRGLLLGAIWLATVTGGVYLLPVGEPREMWTIAGGTETPPGFRYLMFAGPDGAELFDKPDGLPVGRLDRALANSQEEIDAGGFARVLGVDADRWVRLHDLRFEPADGRWDGPVEAWRALVLDPNRTSDWRNVSMTKEPLLPGEQRVQLRFTWHDGGWEQYEYTIGAAGAQAQRWLRYNAKAAAFDGLTNLAIVSLAAAAVAVAISRIAGSGRRLPRPASGG